MTIEYIHGLVDTKGANNICYHGFIKPFIKRQCGEKSTTI
jgi:hypothetical protein